VHFEKRRRDDFETANNSAAAFDFRQVGFGPTDAGIRTGESIDFRA